MLTAANAHTPGDDPQSVIAAEFGVTLISRRTAMVYANPPVASADGNASENGSHRVTFDARHSATRRVLPGVKPAPPNRDHLYVDELIRGLHRERRCRGVGGRSGEPRDTDRDESEEKRAA